MSPMPRSQVPIDEPKRPPGVASSLGNGERDRLFIHVTPGLPILVHADNVVNTMYK